MHFAISYITVEEISNELDIFHRTVHKITVKELQFHSDCTQWMHCLLTKEHKGNSFKSAFKFLNGTKRK